MFSWFIISKWSIDFLRRQTAQTRAGCKCDLVHISFQGSTRNPTFGYSKEEGELTSFRGDTPCVSFNVEECVHGRYYDTYCEDDRHELPLAYKAHTGCLQILFPR